MDVEISLYVVCCSLLENFYLHQATERKNGIDLGFGVVKDLALINGLKFRASLNTVCQMF